MPSELAMQIARAVCHGSTMIANNVGLPLSGEDLEFIRQEVDKFLRTGELMPTAGELLERIEKLEGVISNATPGPSEIKRDDEQSDTLCGIPIIWNLNSGRDE